MEEQLEHAFFYCSIYCVNEREGEQKTSVTGATVGEMEAQSEEF